MENPGLKKCKWPVSDSEVIPAPPERISSVISSPGNLEDCPPFCEKNPVIEWQGAGSQDMIHYYSGWIMQREFVNWIEGVGYDLTISRGGGGKSFVSWRITAEGQSAGVLRITIYPHIFQDMPVVIRRMCRCPMPDYRRYYIPNSIVFITQVTKDRIRYLEPTENLGIFWEPFAAFRKSTRSRLLIS